jgi:hypothetical protein
MRLSLNPYVSGSTYDLSIGVCGYEASGTHFLDSDRPLSKKKIAIGYGRHETLSFKKNRIKYRNCGYQFSSVEDADFPEYISNITNELIRKIEQPRIFVDISCLTRLRLAQIIESFSKISCRVDFSYTLAKFCPPKKRQSQNEFLEPVTSFFSGWSGDIDRPIAVVSGLGYEYMRAIGTIEQLDASDVWLFFPHSPIIDYDKEVLRANELLVNEIEPSRILHYHLDDFLSLCRNIFSLSGSLRSTHRCALLPLGPKQFALSAFLAGAMYRDVSVWRASAGEFAEPTERLASDYHFRVSVSFDSLAQDFLNNV